MNFRRQSHSGMHFRFGSAMLRTPKGALVSTARFDLVTTASGALSIRDNAVGEIMHNPVGPWEEANGLYIEPSNLRERLSRRDALAGASPLVLFDVGLGAAANALAAVRAALNTEDARRPLHIVSFENDLALLDFTLHHADRIPYVGDLGEAVLRIYTDRSWTSRCGRISWRLHVGDFVDCVPQESLVPDIVFYDPYSPAMNPSMWTRQAFARLFDACDSSVKTTTLHTYTIATHARTSMLLAGFYVGRGPATGLKRETTQASTHPQALKEPLDERWLVRWLRSHVKWMGDVNDATKRLWTHEVLSHPQFYDLVRMALLPSFQRDPEDPRR